MANTFLVTGATGFIGHHVVGMALEQGSQVIATSRQPDDDARTAPLKSLNGASERLSWCRLELSGAEPFVAPIDAEHVIHLAWPEPGEGRQAGAKLVETAIKSTLSLLKAAAKSARVNRVVITSSLSAIADQPGDTTLTDEHWNIHANVKRDAVAYAKTSMERAAWEFMEREKPGFELVVINPAPVTGPSPQKRLSVGNGVIADIVRGRYRAILPIVWPLVDARDVARSLLAAATIKQADGRYLCAADSFAMADLVEMIRCNGYGHAPLPKKGFTGFLARSLISPASLMQSARPDVGWRQVPDRAPAFTNARLRGDLGVWFRHREDMVADALADLAAHGHISAPGPKEDAPAFNWDEELIGR